jgi:hypothetical protein
MRVLFVCSIGVEYGPEESMPFVAVSMADAH